MRNILIVGLFFPLLYIGCDEGEQKSADRIEIEKSNSDLNVIQSMNSKDLLGQLGFDINKEKISFDINQTTNFVKQMEIEMHGKADEIQNKIQRADINFTRDIGISFTNEKIEIDLNKTKKMFQEINILMKEVLLDKNSSKY